MIICQKKQRRKTSNYNDARGYRRSQGDPQQQIPRIYRQQSPQRQPEIDNTPQENKRSEDKAESDRNSDLQRQVESLKLLVLSLQNTLSTINVGKSNRVAKNETCRGTYI